MFIVLDNSLVTPNTWVKSALLPPLLVGVPTQIKIISDFLTDSFKFVENVSLFCFVFLITSSSKPGS